MNSMLCLRCNNKMQYVCREKLQLGETGLIFGTLPNLFAGALTVNIYLCESCGKLEFFSAEENENEEKLPQKQCPKCGLLHDFDFPKCPACRYDYSK